MKTALDSARAELDKKQASERAELDRKASVYAILPGPDVPLIGTFQTPTPHDPRAWINFYGPAYDPEKKCDPVAVLEKLESAGWSALPAASLIRWDKWRRHMEPAPLLEAANYPHKSGYSYTDGDDMPAYWMEPQQYTSCDFNVFMKAPDGMIYRVSLDVPGLACLVGTRENSPYSGQESTSALARFVRCRVGHPSHWKTHPRTAGYVDTAQGISGAIYFPLGAYPEKASEALRRLMAKE